ncbi:MAG: hypothetical protein M1829_004354 [Trizodia sp. TS-e1964]|nr:MAG: hypothetical protein M1829_004354 [Trizodia sp. TS-e1964]
MLCNALTSATCFLLFYSFSTQLVSAKYLFRYDAATNPDPELIKDAEIFTHLIRRQTGDRIIPDAPTQQEIYNLLCGTNPGPYLVTCQNYIINLINNAVNSYCSAQTGAYSICLQENLNVLAGNIPPCNNALALLDLVNCAPYAISAFSRCVNGQGISTVQGIGACVYLDLGILNPLPVPTDAPSATVGPQITTTSTVGQATPSATIALSAGSFTYTSCNRELASGRALTGPTMASDTMTIETCATFCSGYNYFGVEDGRECYCGNSIDTGAAPVVSESYCNHVCIGNVREICGGATGGRGYISLYAALGPAPSTTGTITSSSSTSSASLSTTTTSTSSTTSTTSTTSSAPSTSSNLSGYQGCYIELQRGRALAAKNFASNTMTLESCATFCAGTTYYGLENGREW